MNELSIVLPCIHSVEMLPGFIDKLATRLMENPSDIDLIIVTNEIAGSGENLIKCIRAKYPWLKFEFLQRRGGARSYGALVKFGLAYSSSIYVVLVSPYDEDDLNSLSKMLAELRKGAQVAQATRYFDESGARQIPLKYRIYQAIYRLLTKLMLGFYITDSTYNFKMFDRIFVQSFGLAQNGFSISSEIIFKSSLAGGRVVYVPSKSKISSINRDFKLYKEGIGYFWLLLRGLAHRLGILWF